MSARLLDDGSHVSALPPLMVDCLDGVLDLAGAAVRGDLDRPLRP